MDTLHTAPAEHDALLASYREALAHTNALTDRISTDQFSAHYPERPDWAIGPFVRQAFQRPWSPSQSADSAVPVSGSL